MALILNIDTATEVASACLSDGSQLLAIRENHQQKEHASFINVAIGEIFKEANLSVNSMEAVAVTIGPGSYTGLRVGLATAKGFCYALKVPLITLSTLKVMTIAAKKHVIKNKIEGIDLFCPMIDARRMEVFTALFDEELNPVLAECALELSEKSFSDYILKNSIFFFGNGSNKFSSFTTNEKNYFGTVQHNASDIIPLAQQAFTRKRFTNLAYAEPNYLKEFFTPAKIFKY